VSGPVLELRDVAVAYDGKTVLEVARLAVNPGEVLTLVGENGSGKTTLLRLLGLLVRPGRGQVLLGGERVDFGRPRRLLELRRRMAAVMQQPLLCKMNVRRNVGLGLRFRRLPRAEIDARVDAWLQRLSIAHLRDRPAGKLSGGEAQRASLARAMALDPRVLLLDEPFAALGPALRAEMLDLVARIRAEARATLILVTHQPEDARRIAERLLVIDDGVVRGPFDTAQALEGGVAGIGRYLGAGEDPG
jgi:tungstate transport system ATP-binding protein